MHFKKQCKHGKLLGQCRCHGPKATTIVDCFPSCEMEKNKEQNATKG